MAWWRKNDRRSTFQYVIRLARVLGSIMKVNYQVSQSNWFDSKDLVKNCPSFQIRDWHKGVRFIDNMKVMTRKNDI